MSSVETIGWRGDVSCIKHSSKQLSHERMVLACLFGQFFGTKWTVRCLQDLEDILSLKGEGYASSEDGCDWKVIRAEPLDGGDAICIGDDLVGQVVSFFAEVVFDGDKETLVFVRRVPGDEEASASCGDDTDGAATSIEWVLGVAFIEVTNDQNSTVGTIGHECQI